jgi:hypothetical protein
MIARLALHTPLIVLASPIPRAFSPTTRRVANRPEGQPVRGYSVFGSTPSQFDEKV